MGFQGFGAEKEGWFYEGSGFVSWVFGLGGVGWPFLGLGLMGVLGTLI